MRLCAARMWVRQDAAGAGVAFADRKEDPATYVIVARELAPDPMRRRLGLDGVYVEINDAATSAYRAATGFGLAGTELRIVLSQAALGKLDLTGDLCIELAEPGMNNETLRAALAAIFARKPHST